MYVEYTLCEKGVIKKLATVVIEWSLVMLLLLFHHFSKPVDGKTSPSAILIYFDDEFVLTCREC